MSNLFHDIETIPDQREGALQNLVDNIAAPARYKKPESIQKWINDEGPTAAVEEWKKTALHGIAGQIVSIAWAFDDLPITGEIDATTKHNGEELLLCTFFEAIYRQHKSGEGKYQEITWIGHNCIDFDIRFLYQRAAILGIKPEFVLPTDARHGRSVYDTMNAWCGWRGSRGGAGYAKQDELYAALGGEPFENDDMDGSQVWDYIQAGRYDEVLAYNKRDVEKLRFNYKRLTWQ